MKKLPRNLRHVRSTPVFNEDTLPKGLLQNHRTQAGTWGKIVIESGQLEYTIESNPPEVLRLEAGQIGVIEPEENHRIKPLGQVRFHVEFYK